ncbi:MAG TPA: hypothetical protein DCG39_06760 [Opitutae bacterium]|nr:hypothetical protein [Opitutae bacterium]
MFGSQQQGIASRYYNIFYLGMIANIIEACVPIGWLCSVSGFAFDGCASANNATSRTKGTINRTEGNRQKQSLVGITMHKMRANLTPLFIQGVVIGQWVVRFIFRSEWKKLSTQRVMFGILPIYSGKDIRSEPYVHSGTE